MKSPELLRARASHDSEGCLIYTYGADLSGGYGQFRGPWGVSAHRAAFWFEYGDIPDGYSVLHHCDKRRCIDPFCLFLGTAADNTADMYSKGRQGSWKTRKVSDDILRRWLAGESSADLAAEIGCHRNSIAWAYRNRMRG